MQLLLIAGGEGEVGESFGESDGVGAERIGEGRGVAVGKEIEIGCCLCEEFGVATLGALRGLLQQEGSGAQGEGYVLRLIGCASRGGNVLGGDSLSQIGAPCTEMIDPGLDGVEPVAKLVHDKGGGPEIVG